ncbi:MAG: glutamate--cysteine ligase [Tindallia sp. MSAO_Bac2]|nr:MAG: glutamate--cysteine ligase [Tindallia sp. MSAO_Bac2]
MDICMKKENRMVELIQKGEKTRGNMQLGMELEHIAVDQKTGQSISYGQQNGIKEILRKMADEKNRPVMEEDHLIGLSHPDYQVTLEPGGQIEISIRPCDDTAVMLKIYREFLDRIIPIITDQGQWLLCVGYHPKSSIADIPFNPKKRYAYMSEYLIKHGCFAHNMMKGTASLQVVIDYYSQEDFIRKFRVAHFLMPMFALLTDNAPYFEGVRAPHHSIRTAIWDETDPARCGLVPGVMDKSFDYHDYARYILQICPIMIKKGDAFLGINDKKVVEMEGFELLSDDEVDHILSMVFPDIRLRQYIEIRMADSIPYPYNFGFVALIKGIFYQEEALDYLYRLSLNTTDEKLHYYRRQIMDKGYDGKFVGHTCREMLMTLFDLAKRDLNEQEQHWISSLEDLAIQQKTLAEIYRERAEEDPEWMKYLTADFGFKGEQA